MQALRDAGATQERLDREERKGELVVLESNIDVVILYLRSYTQRIIDISGNTMGFDYHKVEFVADRIGVDFGPANFEKFQIMEAELIRIGRMG